jgi:hypothetical protein
LADDHLVDLHWGSQVGLSAEQAVDHARSVLHRSLTREHGAIAAIFHVDPYAVDERWRTEAARWLERVLDYAVEHDIPIWSAEEWLRFTEIRHDATIKEDQWHSSARRLSFQLAARSAAEYELAVMVPL